MNPAELTQRVLAASDPAERLQAIVALRHELETIEIEAVAAAVGAGASWADVATAMGITKQSAHRRFAKRLNGSEPPRGRPERDHAFGEAHVVVTPEARHAVRAARAAARFLGHTRVDSAHLLLGLLTDPQSAAARALNEIGVEFEAARDAIAALGLRRSRADPRKRRRIPISPATRQVLQQSLREVSRLGHSHLGAEHLLLALLHDESGGAVRTLAALDVSAHDLERCLGKILRSGFRRLA